VIKFLKDGDIRKFSIKIEIVFDHFLICAQVFDIVIFPTPVDFLLLDNILKMKLD
jgi:hypothetical protein